jgi:hypothetical protein
LHEQRRVGIRVEDRCDQIRDDLLLGGGGHVPPLPQRLPHEVRERWIGRNGGSFISQGTGRGRREIATQLQILAEPGVSPLDLLPLAPSLR